MLHEVVALFLTQNKTYPTQKPYNPHSTYPEYRFKQCNEKERNDVYDCLRQACYSLGLDKERFNSQEWNPLGSFIKPGNLVVIKPNLLKEATAYDPELWECVMTHGSLIRAVIDYVYIALRGDGRIVICDSPVHDSEIGLIKKRIGIEDIQSLYWDRKKFEVEFYDLRNMFWVERDGIIVDSIQLPGDPTGCVKFDLGKLSMFSELDGQNRRYYGAFYDIDETNAHHHGGKHEYLVSKLAIDADVFINLPKLKTHKKVGATLNLKNLVGINGNKNWLPHYCFGSPQSGGDQFPGRTVKSYAENHLVRWSKRLLLKRSFSQSFFAKYLSTLGYKIFGKTEEVIRSGNWYGNDTTWRMCLDLNRILLYGTKNGTLSDKRKQTLSVVDGIIGMHGNGPQSGNPIQSGVIAVGLDFLNVDLACTKIIGFDYERMNLLANAFNEHKYPIYQNPYHQINVVSNREKFNRKLTDIKVSDVIRFEPHFGWGGHIELTE